MPVLKVYIDGVWEELGGSSAADGGNAETLNGKTETYFASAQSVSDLQTNLSSEIDDIQSYLQENIGDTPVAEQIANAVKNIEIPSIDGLATEQYVDNAVANIKIPDVDFTGYVTETYVNTALSGKSDIHHVHDQYANLSDVSDLQTKVGDKLVTEQIEDAIKNLNIESEILHIQLDLNNNTCSHSASEIATEIFDNNKFPIVNDNPNFILIGYLDGGLVFEYTYIYRGGEIEKLYIAILDDKSCVVLDFSNNTHAVYVITVDNNNIASDDISFIHSIIHDGHGVVMLYYNGYLYNYQYTEHIGDADFASFICHLNNGYTKYTSIVTIDMDGNVGEVHCEESIIPVSEESDAGKVLVAGSNRGQVSWENLTSNFVDQSQFNEMVGDESVSDQIEKALVNFSSGKTLTEHLVEEDMVLSSRQYGDRLPDPGIPGRIFFLRVSD